MYFWSREMEQGLARSILHINRVLQYLREWNTKEKRLPLFLVDIHISQMQKTFLTYRIPTVCKTRDFCRLYSSSMHLGFIQVCSTACSDTGGLNLLCP